MAILLRCCLVRVRQLPANLLSVIALHAGTTALQRKVGNQNCWSNVTAHNLAGVPAVAEIVQLSLLHGSAQLKRLVRPLQHLVDASTGVNPLNAHDCLKLSLDFALTFGMDGPDMPPPGDIQRDFVEVFMCMLDKLVLAASAPDSFCHQVVDCIERTFGAMMSTTTTSVQYTTPHGKILPTAPNKGSMISETPCTEGIGEHETRVLNWGMVLTCKTPLDRESTSSAVGCKCTHFRACTHLLDDAVAVEAEMRRGCSKRLDGLKTVSAALGDVVVPLGDLLKAAMITTTIRIPDPNDACKYCGVTTSFTTFTTMIAMPPVLVVAILRLSSQKVAIPFELEVLNGGLVNATHRLVSVALRRGFIQPSTAAYKTSERGNGHYYALLMPTSRHSRCRIIDDGTIIDVGDPRDALVFCSRSKLANDPKYNVQSNAIACIFTRTPLL